MALNLTNGAYALKTLWPTARVQNLVYKNQPALAMLPKDEKFFGKNAVIPVQYADTQGRSATFSTAQANKGNHSGVAFTITRAKDYVLASVDNEALKASANDAGAVVNLLDQEIGSSMNAIKRSAGQSVFRSGTGTIGVRGSNSGSTTTLATKQDIANFEVGMKIQAAATDGGAVLDSGNALTVTAIDRDAGTFTYTGTISGYADTNFLLPAGDSNLKVKGFAAWLPTSAPTNGDNFFGVDRSADAVRLAGKRIDISALPPSEGLVQAANSLALEGASPDVMFVNFAQYTNIEHDLGSKVQYLDLKVGEVGFQAIRINGPAGTIKVLPDINCPYNLGYMLQMDTWKLFSLGAMPDFIDTDGMKMLRESSSDGVEVRIGYYAQLYCNAPGWNAVVTMPT